MISDCYSKCLGKEEMTSVIIFINLCSFLKRGIVIGIHSKKFMQTGRIVLFSAASAPRPPSWIHCQWGRRKCSKRNDIWTVLWKNPTQNTTLVQSRHFILPSFIRLHQSKPLFNILTTSIVVNNRKTTKFIHQLGCENSHPLSFHTHSIRCVIWTWIKDGRGQGQEWWFLDIGTGFPRGPVQWTAETAEFPCQKRSPEKEERFRGQRSQVRPSVLQATNILFSL